MPKCKYCRKNISKFDKDRCPYCGNIKPLEGVESFTSDITQTIDTIEENEVNYVVHSKLINSLLLMFLGIFGVDSFYLGFIKEGLIRVAINIIIYSGLFCLFYFVQTNKENNMILLLSLLVPLLILFIAYFVIGIISFFKKNKKDSNGVFLK